MKDPATFKAGDIVEILASFVLVPARNGGHSMQIFLRGVTLLDNSFSKVRDDRGPQRNGSTYDA